MIDVCIDARMAHSSGIGTCIRQLVPLLNQPPFRIILLVDKLGQSWCKDIEQILFPASIYSIQEQIAFPLKVPKCDIFWSPHYNTPLIPIHAKKRVVTIHDACHLALKQFLSWPEHFYAKFLMNHALHHSDAVVTVSQFSKEELIRYLGVPKKPLQVILNAVNRDRFQRLIDPSTREALRQKYQLPKNFVLFVGNLKPHKNLSGLMASFSFLPRKDLKLVIVGNSKNMRNSINISEQKIFQVLENVPDVDLPGIYSLAQLFVMPSFYEGFGAPPLEAMSCGCPTIVSKAASLPEVCGDATIYVDPNNPREMANAMLQVANDPKLQNELIQKGLKRANHFQWSQTAERYRALFLALIFKRAGTWNHF